MLFRIGAQSRVLKKAFYCSCRRNFSKRMHAEEKYLVDLDIKAEKSISDLKEIKSGMMIHKARMEIFLKNSRENQPDMRTYKRK